MFADVREIFKGSVYIPLLKTGLWHLKDGRSKMSIAGGDKFATTSRVLKLFSIDRDHA